jgi:hypothetical protein
MTDGAAQPGLLTAVRPLADWRDGPAFRPGLLASHLLEDTTGEWDGTYLNRDTTYARLKEHVRIGLIDSVQPASESLPIGWHLTINGRPFILTNENQVLIWLAAGDAFIALLDREINGHVDWPF